MRLHELLDATEVLEILHDAPVDVTDVTHDSRSVAPGALFACIPGLHADGHSFASAAVDRGAVALLVEHAVAPGVPQARVASVRRSVGPLAARVHGDPSTHIPVVGITGTNGKTTTTYLLEAIFDAAGMRAAVVGTLGIRLAGTSRPMPFTTPEAPDLQRSLAALRSDGADVVAMEVSSHALSEHRVDGTRFAVVCFTNLSREHLDHHGTMEAYAAAKERLFSREFSDRAVINLDDPYGRELVDIAVARGLHVVGYSVTTPIAGGARAVADDAVVRAADLVEDLDGTRFRLHVAGDAVDLRLPLPGRFNVANAAAAAATAHALGIDAASIAAGLSRTAAIPGRFEAIGTGRPIGVIVDYAHTPDGIATALAAGRALGSGRLIVVFGCGGDRDATKRAPMGAAAGRGGDFVVLTTDNPRSEDPAAIAAAAAEGLRAVGADFAIELDRRLAIRSAMTRAEPGDLVLILGKGAESEQRIGDRAVPFDDRIVAAQELAAAWS